MYRTTRRLSLTAAGQQLAGAARAMLTEAEVGLAELGTQGVNASGTLKITAPAILQFSRFVTRTATFIRHHPNVEISMGFSDRDRDIIAEGYDIGFRLGPLANSTLISRQLVEGKMVLCASPDFVKSNAPIRGPDDIFNIDAIATVGQALRLVLNPRSETKRRTRSRLYQELWSIPDLPHVGWPKKASGWLSCPTSLFARRWTTVNWLKCWKTGTRPSTRYMLFGHPMLGQTICALPI